MSHDEMDDDGKYAIGKGKPPKQHRWKKGQSGNPRGRPKARKPDPVDVSAILDAPVEARLRGKLVTVSAYEASFRQVAKKAISGHLPSIVRFLKSCEECGVTAPPKSSADGGVVFAPKGVDLDDWLEEVTEWVPDDEF